ncbi:hypothetical protein [Corynebacterium sp.]|uniref:hypothetical protein n=1 Tax=Corynebacterium sp. TaxID=1720 RepID=UPI0026DB0A5A|nr:hypothetical protein [Corynebacterium sp.]MDO4915140.1 hypothetical protein [Corynebacterium sp.]
MYAWIWRHLPGPTWFRVIEALVLIAAVVLILMQFVFPVVSDWMPYNDVRV